MNWRRILLRLLYLRPRIALPSIELLADCSDVDSQRVSALAWKHSEIVWSAKK